MLKKHFSKEINKKLKYDFHFIHRLDYSTSGVLCVGFNKTAASIIGKCFQNRKVDKYYLAIVHGHIYDKLMEINYQIGMF